MLVSHCPSATIRAGKLIRLPDIAYSHAFDRAPACEAFLLGRGPRTAHRVIHK